MFIRLAGCSVGCRQCDTDYRVARRAPAEEVAAEATRVRGNARWCWITGGEPTDRDLGPLRDALRGAGFESLALATSGIRSVRWGEFDWVSVSPHTPGLPAAWQGDEVKLVAGLNGLNLADCDPDDYDGFSNRYVAPCEDNYSDAMRECLDWVSRHRGWRLGWQAHKTWGLD